MTLNEIKAWYYHPKTVIPKSLTIGCEHMKDVRSTIQSLIRVLEAHSGNRDYLPYFEQLFEIYNEINKN